MLNSPMQLMQLKQLKMSSCVTLEAIVDVMEWM